MIIKVLKNEAEYKQALHEAELLMDSKPGSTEENQLEVLSVLIEKYEDEHYPIEMPDPISAIKFRMEQQGLKQKDLVPFIGSQPKVSAVLNGKRELSKEMIRKLHDGLGIPLEVLMNRPGSENTEPDFSFADYPFFNEMVKKGFFPGQNSVREAKKIAQSLLNELFSVIDESGVQLVYTRKSSQLQPPDAEALKAWQACVLHRVKGVSLPPFSREVVQSSLVNELVLQSKKINPDKIKQTLNNAGIHFVILPHLEHTYLDGAAFINNTGNPVIGMTLRHDRLDNFWFTLFHELGHIFLHLSQDSTLSFFDDTESVEVRSADAYEREANEFSQNAMIPYKKWQDFISSSRPFTESKVKAFARKLGITPAIPAGRLRYESQNYSGLNKLVGAHCVRDAFEDYEV